jgi:hypothetical protein
VATVPHLQHHRPGVYQSATNPHAGNQRHKQSRRRYPRRIPGHCQLLIQIELNDTNDTRTELPVEETLKLYDKYARAAKQLMENKNHDYGEAWREMRVSSLTDMILVKLLRIKQIEDNEGQTVASEGIDANYFDIINYAIFALIRTSGQ